MSFRDLQKFNPPMLAKQVWRLIHNTRLLFYRVYKARYFPNFFFLDTELGSNPSFVWRSLLASRDIIHAGSRWKIADGWKKLVTTHSWLPHSPAFLNAPSRDMRVYDFIDEDTRQLDKGKLFATFDRRTCEAILALPLNHQNSQDKLIWKKNGAHKFSVRIAYQVVVRLKHPNHAKHSSVQAHSSFGGKIWKLIVPPKVGTFLWRACSDCLPTRENLQKKRVRVEVTCELCCHHLESRDNKPCVMGMPYCMKCLDSV